MIDVVDVSLERPRFEAMLLTAFSVVALLLAQIGLYEVTAYANGSGFGRSAPDPRSVSRRVMSCV